MNLQDFVRVSLLLLCGNAAEIPETISPAQKYGLNANASKILQREDRRIMGNWSEEYQVRRLDISLKYRMQMVKHEEHSFKTDGNEKWMKCLHIHRNKIRKLKQFYHDNEIECLRIYTSKDAGNRETVEQLDKQMVKWRKGYKYLVNLCHTENSANKGTAQQCLVEYMENDNYGAVIERLMLLKQSAMSDLYAYYNSSLIELEDCLKTKLSRYLDRVRDLKATLNKCYSFVT